MPLVSVVVPVLDDAARLVACLDALHEQRGAPAFEVVVVDNGSSDNSVAVARGHAVAPVVVAEARRGSYAARNAGLAVARGSVIAFTDADCLPAQDWIARGAAALAASTVVGGDVRPTRSASASVWERLDRAIYLRQGDLVVQQGYSATANLWVRRDVLDEVGPFDADLLSSGDFEWGQRALALGHRAAFSDDVVVGHAPRTTRSQTWQLHRRLGAGWGLLVDRFPHLRQALWFPLGATMDLIAADGPPLRRRQVAPAHAVAMAARRVGYSTSRRARTEP